MSALRIGPSSVAHAVGGGEHLGNVSAGDAHAAGQGAAVRDDALIQQVAPLGSRAVASLAASGLAIAPFAQGQAVELNGELVITTRFE